MCVGVLVRVGACRCVCVGDATRKEISCEIKQKSLLEIHFQFVFTSTRTEILRGPTENIALMYLGFQHCCHGMRVFLRFWSFTQQKSVKVGVTPEPCSRTPHHRVQVHDLAD